MSRASTHSNTPFEINQDLWFDDGDIRVCARRFGSGRLCLYKLYRDLLADQSVALLDLLDESFARRRCLQVEDTPYAFLPDDDAFDLERFFLAIHYPIYFLFQKNIDRSFARMLPVFRVALKYKAGEVIEALASQLEQDMPQTISEWDGWLECEDDLRIAPELVPEKWAFNQTSAIVVESASAIQVAHIANMQNVLSVAYYQLSRISASNDWWQDIVSQTLGAKDCIEEEEELVYSRRPTLGNADRQTLLSKEDLRRISSGKERLAKYMLGLKKRLLRELLLHPRCGYVWSTGATMTSEDPLTHLSELCSAEVFSAKMICTNCRFLINRRGREERARVWELLPQLFCSPLYVDTS